MRQPELLTQTQVKDSYSTPIFFFEGKERKKQIVALIHSYFSPLSYTHKQTIIFPPHPGSQPINSLLTPIQGQSANVAVAVI